MRVIFMGTPSFAVASLEALYAHHELCAVVTRPDAASKRGKALHPSPVKQRALELGFPEEKIICTKSLRSDEIQTLLKSFNADLFVVAAYSAILPKELLEIPPYGCINVHASLLPRWRGAAPIQRAILAGDEYAGVCIMKMEEGLDTGDYCLCAQTKLADKSADELSEELGSLGAKALISALESLEAGSLNWVKQDESLVSYAEKLAKHECLLQPSLSAHKNALRVQASSDSAPARFVFCNEQGADLVVRVLKARALQEEDPLIPSLIEELSCNESSAELVVHEKASPKKASDKQPHNKQTLSELAPIIKTKRALYLCCDDKSFLELLELKPEGKQAMAASAWAQGLSRYSLLSWRSL